MNNYYFFLMLVTIFLKIGCNSNINGNDNIAAIEEDGKIFIEDQTGKLWDITHAINKYGFQSGHFQFGLGPFAITPINNPDMLSPGDPGYPDTQDNSLVIGTTINNDTRAYSINHLTRHEIVNESFAETHVSVAY